MEEIETPTEKVLDEIHERAHHAEEAWISRVALSTAVLAVFAAISALLAGHHANEAMIDQIKASDQWNLFQAKGIKAEVVKTRAALLETQGAKLGGDHQSQLDKYAADKDKSKEMAEEFEHHSEAHLSQHTILAGGVTMFQVAIAIAAISVLMRRRAFWYFGLAFGVAGLAFFITGLVLSGLSWLAAKA